MEALSTMHCFCERVVSIIWIKIVIPVSLLF